MLRKSKPSTSLIMGLDYQIRRPPRIHLRLPHRIAKVSPGRGPRIQPDIDNVRLPHSDTPALFAANSDLVHTITMQLELSWCVQRDFLELSLGPDKGPGSTVLACPDR